MDATFPLIDRRRAITIVAAAALGSMSCRSKGPSADGDQATQRNVEGDFALFGGPSSRGVVLIAGDRRTGAWSAFATELGRLGYRVLVLPLPGNNPEAAALAAAEVLARQGVERIVFVGSGAGADAALAGAAAGAAGVVILNPIGAAQTVPGAGMPSVASLMMASLSDGPSSATAQKLYQSAPEPRRLALYPARDPAPAAFTAAGELRTAFLDFLQAAFTPLSA
jgi:dienelactone hydrolase